MHSQAALMALMAGAAFMDPRSHPAISGELPAPKPLFARSIDIEQFLSPETREAMAQVQRGEFTGTPQDIAAQLNMTLDQFMRGITSSISAFPVREDLEAEAKLLIPLDTPLRNKLPRIPGAGLAHAWKQLTSIGMGLGGETTTSGSGNSAAQADITVVNAGGIAAGETLYIGSGGTAETKIVSSVNYSTNVITLTTNLANAQNSVSVIKLGQQPGTGEALRAFFSETGAPAEQTSAYADKSASYKLMGRMGSVTGFSMAAGANFQNQYAMEKTNVIRSVMMAEENALINGDASAIAAPWGDGTNALAFNGLRNLITTANGVPAQQVQTAVGAITTDHFSYMLNQLWLQGAQGEYILINERESRSLAELATASGSIIRVQATSDGKTVLGMQVTGIVHPITGRVVPIHVSRFVEPGTMYWLSESIPDGSPTMQVAVLPQVQLPSLAPNDMIQGYVAQELAPSHAAPQVFKFIVSVYEVPMLKSAKHVGVSKGVTAPA
jgi:hypothetical protein